MNDLENGYFHIYENGDVEYRSYETMGGGMFFIIAVALFVSVFTNVANYVLDNPYIMYIATAIIVLLRTIIVDKKTKLKNRIIIMIADTLKLLGICGIITIFFDFIVCHSWLDKVFFSILGVAVFCLICKMVGGFLLFLRASNSTAFYVILCVIIFVIGFFVNTNFARYKQGYDYKVFLNNATITGYDSKRISGYIEVPAHLRNYKVTTLGDGKHGTFNAKNILSVTIPEGISTIKQRAFSYSSVEQINIPATVSKIEDDAFYSNKNLKYINISPDNKYFIFENGVLYSYDKSRIVWTSNE